VVLQADVDAAVQEGARRQHHGACAKAQADLRHGADHAVAVQQQVVHRLLEQPQVRAGSPAAGGSRPCRGPVGLRARGAHGRALAAVEDAELDAGLVGGRAIAPPSASTSLTRWPLPMPPIDGLQLICPSVSMLCVSSSVRSPCAPRPARPRCRHGRRRRR
jgi:hypothetical protein